MEYVCLNGEFEEKERAKISVFDRGFLYGDGIYETLRVYHGKPFKVDEHWKRLNNSAQRLALSLPIDCQQFEKLSQRLLEMNELKEALVRLSITRGLSEIGHSLSASLNKPTFVIMTKEFHGHPAELYERGVRVIIAEVRRNSAQSLDPAVKSNNFLNNILAKKEADEKGAFEAIMCNHKAYLAEGSISNFFLLKDGILLTPGLECGLLSGITRKTIIALATERGIPVEEERLVPEDLFQAQEAFLTSTTLEVMPISQVNDKKVGNGEVGPMTRSLHSAYRKLLEAFIKEP